MCIRNSLALPVTYPKDKQDNPQKTTHCLRDGIDEANDNP